MDSLNKRQTRRVDVKHVHSKIYKFEFKILLRLRENPKLIGINHLLI